MSPLTPIRFQPTELDQIATAEGRVVVVIPPEGQMDQATRRANRLTKGAIARLVESARFAKAKPGQVITLAWPAGMAAEALDVLVLPKRPDVTLARKAGAALGALKDSKPMMVMTGNSPRAAEIAMGLALRCYSFDAHKTSEEQTAAPEEAVFCHSKAEEMTAATAPRLAVAEGAHMTRDLINEPANVLTTTEFADPLVDMENLGLKVEVLDEDELAKLGMRTLLSVGHGSDSPSKVVVMQWNGGEKDAAPLALIGKGVVFDTGGISLKPAAGMEDMTMDMGGAGVVASAMRALALRKAKANVVGLVGLVENMPSGRATRPGDVVKSMKGDTVEIINTDAEGRLVLCDVVRAGPVQACGHDRSGHADRRDYHRSGP